MGRGKGEGSIWKDSRGLWRVAVELPPGPDGKRRRKVISSKKKAVVVSKLRDLQREKTRSGDLPTRSMTVEAWLTHWLDDIAPRDRRPNTVQGYRSAIQKQITPRVGRLRLDKLTPARIRAVTDAVAEGRSHTYALNVHNILSSALKDAVRDGLLTTHPMEHMRRPRASKTEQNALTLDQAIDVLRWLSDKPDGALWATYLLTAARRNEVLGLEVDRATGDVLDMSWQLQRIADISKAPADYEYRDLGGGYYLARPKSSAGWRVIPLVDPLKTLLSRWIESSGATGLVFPRPDGSPRNPDSVSKEWRAMLVQADVEQPDTPLSERVPLHGARHTAVDILYEAGVPEDVIQRIVGHSTRAMTRSYQTSAGQSQRVIDAMHSMSRLLTNDSL